MKAFIQKLATYTIIISSVMQTNAQDPELGWAKSMGSANSDSGHSIAVDASGNVYTTGIFLETSDFDPGVDIFDLTSAGYVDIFVQKLDAMGNFVWAKRIGGTSDDIGNSIKVDASGNVYTAGYFSGTVDFDPGVGIFDLTSTGYEDIFVQKLDTDGNFIWAKSIGGTYTDNGGFIAVDGSGNVYVAGSFDGTVDFDPGAGSFHLTSAGEHDIFVQKLDTNGNFIWAKSMGGTNSDYVNSIATDGSGNVYTAGGFNGTADFDPGLGSFDLTSVGFNDIFIQKLDINGNFVWAKSMGGTSADHAISIAVSASGNVYSTGFFRETVDFDPGAGSFHLTSAGEHDIFVQKLDTDGSFAWAKRMGGTGYDYGRSITIDDAESVYTTGDFVGTVDFDPGAETFDLNSEGGYEIFVQKLDVDGNLVWAKSMGGINADYGRSIAVDTSENIYTTGYFYGTADFDPGAGTLNLTSEGEQDVFVHKLVQQPMSVNDNELKKTPLYPNPVKDILYFDKEVHKITLTDLTGKVLMTQGNSSQIDMSDFQTGIYFIVIETESGAKEIRKVVKK